MTRRNFSLSDFYCTECGNRGLSIPRKHGQARESGHIKDLLCIYCNKRTKHVEISEHGGYTYFDFKQDFEDGVFKEVDENEE